MSSSQGQVITIGVVFLILPTAFVALRIWAKTLSRGGLALDDHMIFLALATTIACCTVQLVAAVHGQLGQHQKNTPEGLPILDDPRFLLYERCKFALTMLTYLGYGFSKASILIFYLRIFDVQAFRIWPKILLGVVGAWTVSFFFASLFQCYPITALIEPFYHNKCVNGLPLWYTGGITDIIIDFAILAMPIPMVLRLHLPWKQKLGVVFIFLTGALAAASSIARLVVYVQVGNDLHMHFNDETYYTTPVFVWSMIELSLAVISACLPTLRPLYLKYIGSAASNAGSCNSYRLDSPRYGRTRSARLTSKDSLYDYNETQALHPANAAVHTRINKSESVGSTTPKEGVIKVSQSIEHV